MQEFRIEQRVVIQCMSCKRLAKHCKCGNPIHKEVTQEHKIPLIVEQEAGGGQRVYSSEEERLAAIAAKFAEKEEARRRKAELSAIMTMDPEDLAEKKLKEEMDSRKVSKSVESEAKSFVDLIEAKKTELENSGLSPREVMKSIQQYKRELRTKSEPSPSLESQSLEEISNPEKMQSFLADLDAEVPEEELNSPVKDPTTGEFIEEGLDSVQLKEIKRGRKNREK